MPQKLCKDGCSLLRLLPELVNVAQNLDIRGGLTYFEAITEDFSKQCQHRHPDHRAGCPYRAEILGSLAFYFSRKQSV